MSKLGDDSSANLPLSDAVFQVLLSLAGETLHGYAIMQEVEQRTGGRVRLGPGTLYGAIKRLRRDGMIEEVSDDPESSGDERRRLYRLTAFGRSVAMHEAQRLEQLVATARRKDLLPRGGNA